MLLLVSFGVVFCVLLAPVIPGRYLCPTPCPGGPFSHTAGVPAAAPQLGGRLPAPLGVPGGDIGVWGSPPSPTLGPPSSSGPTGGMVLGHGLSRAAFRDGETAFSASSRGSWSGARLVSPE